MNVILVGLPFAEWDRKKDRINFKLVPGTQTGPYVAFIVLSDGDKSRAYSISVDVLDYIPLEGEDEEKE